MDSVSAHVARGHRRAVRAANTELLVTYWAIGREILDRQQPEGWGAKVIDRLSADLKERFPEARGYSPRNLKYLRAMAAAWSEGSVVQRSAAQLPGRHHQYLFLATAEKQREWDLEQALIDHVGRFLLEMGQGFAFVGRQVRLELGGDEFFCDLLFYHLRLRRYVVLELKAVKFEPAFLGQLGMYMTAVDDLLAHPDDQPTIGLLLCKTKNRVVAEYALRGMTSPVGVAEWTDAITTSLPDELTSTLPSIEELESELADAPDVEPSTENGMIMAVKARDGGGMTEGDW